MRGMLRSALLVPLAVVALLGGALGFFVTQQLAPEGAQDSARVSVIALPASPTPAPTTRPAPIDEEDAEEDEDPEEDGGRSGRGSRTDRCPAGCTCESRPPGGIVIRCVG